MKKLFVLLLLTPIFAHSQPFAFHIDATIKLMVNNKELSNAWAGGLNAMQYSTIYLNQDRVEDLVVFDRTSNKLSTFLAVKEGKSGYAYRHAPQYELRFPDVSNWILLADYDRDGRKDIFTHTLKGIKVYRNVTTKRDKGPSWQEIKSFVETQGLAAMVNLQVSVTDIPAITDVDGDDDLDILTYDQSGAFIEYHQNQSMERYKRADSLQFKRINNCWGNFQEGTDCGDFTFGIDCGTTGALPRPDLATRDFTASSNSTGPLRLMHAGSTLLALDLDGDKDKDILVGDISCDNSMMLTNRGSSKAANFTDFQSAYPSSKPIHFPIFPGVFFEDLDFDGKKDLLASPNVTVNEGNRINFGQSNWFYHNKGSNEKPDFEYRQADFLQQTMIDLGANTAPAFADYDGDGDLDLFVGYESVNDASEYSSRVALFENVGSRTAPAFHLSDPDYLRLSQLNLARIRPFFADMNGDGATDFGLVKNVGFIAQVNYFPNAAAKAKPFLLDTQQPVYFPANLTMSDVPFFYDLDHDGDLDVLIGRSQGGMTCQLNTGSIQSPAITFDRERFNHVATDLFIKDIVPVVSDVNGDGKPDLLTGDRKGRLTIYAGTAEKLTIPGTAQTKVIWDELNGRYAEAMLSGSVHPALADLTGDGLPEIILGTKAGGLIYLGNHSKQK